MIHVTRDFGFNLLLFFMQVTTYEKYCGSLSKYGMKYMRAIANMCNVGVTMEKMAVVSIQTCSN
jgi:legumain